MAISGPAARATSAPRRTAAPSPWPGRARRSPGRRRRGGPRGGRRWPRPAATPNQSPTLAETTATTSSGSVTAISTPCGWIAPGTWIGSLAQLSRSTGATHGVIIVAAASSGTAPRRSGRTRRRRPRRPRPDRRPVTSRRSIARRHVGPARDDVDAGPREERHRRVRSEHGPDVRGDDAAAERRALAHVERAERRRPARSAGTPTGDGERRRRGGRGRAASSGIRRREPTSSSTRASSGVAASTWAAISPIERLVERGETDQQRPVLVDRQVRRHHTELLLQAAVGRPRRPTERRDRAPPCRRSSSASCVWLPIGPP